MLTAILLVALFCGAPPTPSPAPARAPSYLETRILNLVGDGERMQLILGKGKRDGVAMGDLVRLPCRPDLPAVMKLLDHRAVVEIDGPRPSPLRVRIGRDGAAPAAWCPRNDPPKEAAPFVEARIVNLIANDPRLRWVINKGRQDGVAVGDKGRLPCRLDVGVVTQVFSRRSAMETDAGPTPHPLRVRIGRDGAVPAPWCPRDEEEGGGRRDASP